MSQGFKLKEDEKADSVRMGNGDLQVFFTVSSVDEKD